MSRFFLAGFNGKLAITVGLDCCNRIKGRVLLLLRVCLGGQLIVKLIMSYDKRAFCVYVAHGEYCY